VPAVAHSRGLAGRATSYYELTKPGIAGFVTILAGVSFYVGARGQTDLLPMVNTLLGTALATGGARSRSTSTPSGKWTRA
jgi:heme O synthase-like polyprenyltransferase